MRLLSTPVHYSFTPLFQKVVMGQKVNPIGFRLGVNRDWRSRWYANPQELPGFLQSDIEIRNYVKKKLQFGALERRRNLALGMVSRRQGAIAHAAHANRLRLRGSKYGLRQDRREVLA